MKIATVFVRVMSDDQNGIECAQAVALRDYLTVQQAGDIALAAACAVVGEALQDMPQDQSAVEKA